jgi:hypothetical protein
MQGMEIITWQCEVVAQSYWHLFSLKNSSEKSCFQISNGLVPKPSEKTHFF